MSALGTQASRIATYHYTSYQFSITTTQDLEKDSKQETQNGRQSVSDPVFQPTHSSKNLETDHEKPQHSKHTRCREGAIALWPQPS
jgi:hypothetical protein